MRVKQAAMMPLTEKQESPMFVAKMLVPPAYLPENWG